MFMKPSMPIQAQNVKISDLVIILNLHGRMKRLPAKRVRALFTHTRDIMARVQTKRSSMRRAFAMLGMGTVVFFAAASLTLLPNGTQASSTEATFMIPAADGYGVAECLISNQACGQVVANAWCEAHGYTKAVSFRQISAEEVTGTIQKASFGPKEPPISVTCTN
ncbi:hypothetical protein FHR70_001562 [Microvirga lupini]|uniref:Uncharacterized protein n=1 Tax=Microvirga lupini TaxID=420324 RepID=A0A7W4VJU4_9HYPH|nr:hypothetical protein [Microvirga lupini]MBB3018508.1 hypothetical protein [Microvirga lupini]